MSRMYRLGGQRVRGSEGQGKVICLAPYRPHEPHLSLTRNHSHWLWYFISKVVCLAIDHHLLFRTVEKHSFTINGECIRCSYVMMFRQAVYNCLQWGIWLGTKHTNKHQHFEMIEWKSTDLTRLVSKWCIHDTELRRLVNVSLITGNLTCWLCEFNIVNQSDIPLFGITRLTSSLMTRLWSAATPLS